MDTGWVTDAVIGSMGRKGVCGCCGCELESLMLMFVMACCSSERSAVPFSAVPFTGTAEARGVV